LQLRQLSFITESNDGDEFRSSTLAHPRQLSFLTASLLQVLFIIAQAFAMTFIPYCINSDELCSSPPTHLRRLLFLTASTAMSFVFYCSSFRSLPPTHPRRISFVTASTAPNLVLYCSCFFIFHRLNSANSCSLSLLLFRSSPPQQRQFLFFTALAFAFVTASTAPSLVPHLARFTEFASR